MQSTQSDDLDPLSMTVQRDATRLDRAVADWRGLSRAAVLRLLDGKAVLRNGQVQRRANKGDLLTIGDRIEIVAVYAKGEAPKPDPALALRVLCEGDGWVAIDKPAGVPVRPHAIDETGSVLNGIVARWPGVVGVGEGGLRCGVLHRLDNDTSGVLMVATQQAAWERMRRAFAEHRVEKRYRALVRGAIRDAGELKRHLRVATHRPARVRVVPPSHSESDARLCSLAWRCVERFDDHASLIEVDLHTGFLHQIRAMMSDVGHPVIGDTTYGSEPLTPAAPRQMLHACSLRFDEVDVKAETPADMQAAASALRAGR